VRGKKSKKRRDGKKGPGKEREKERRKQELGIEKERENVMVED